MKHKIFKLISLFLVISSTSSLIVGCNSSTKSNNNISSSYSSNNSYYSSNFIDNSNNSSFVSTPENNVDLSGYSEYGNWSCGRIWVKSIASDWDTSPEEYFLYLDESGNAISDPFNCDEFIPTDYCNNVVMIKSAPDFQFAYDDGGICYFYDINFNLLGEVYVDYHTVSDELLVTPFNTDGICAYVSLDDYDVMGWSKGMGWVDEKGIHTFNFGTDGLSSYPSSVDDISVSKHDNSITLMLGDFYTYYVGIFDATTGSEIIDVSDHLSQTITSAYLENDIVYVDFIGDDGNYYSCTLDLQGNFLSEPH